MKTLLFVLFVAALAHIVLADERLIVTSDGQSFWGTGVTQSGNSVKYTSKDTGEQKTVAISSLHGVVPRVVRGKKYSADDIKKYIDRITKLKRKHKNLYRQLQSLQQEWQALEKPDSELEGKIDELKQAFSSSDKSTKPYKKAVLGLGMVRYKDVGGKYEAKVDAVLAEMKADYIASNKVWLDEQAQAADTMAFGDFTRFVQLTKDVGKELDADAKAKLYASLAATREKVITAQCKAAYAAFITTKSIDAYLEAARLMLGTKENVADSDEQRSMLDKRMASLVAMAGKSNPGYTFDDMGFPLSSSTRQMIMSAGSACSRGTSGNSDLQEQIFMFPERKPSGLSFGRSFSVPLRLVAQRALPADRNYALVVTYPGAGRLTHKVGTLQFKQGLAQVIFNETFEGVGSRQLQPSEDGRTFFYFHLAYMDEDSGWVPISKTCFWGIAQ